MLSNGFLSDDQTSCEIRSANIPIPSPCACVPAVLTASIPACTIKQLDTTTK